MSSSRELITMIERDGWTEVNQVGSHKQFKHPSKDLPIKTVHSILKQAGLK